ncbi:MAG: hypothetical protein K6F70_08385 [Eggerthellaceae bacterium]|nr:hypothetical protein [Eggerthellaceae bacterium]
MEFHEFAQALYPVLSRTATESNFVRTLLINIVDSSYPDSDGPFALTDQALRHYFNGTRKMGKTARSVVGHLNLESFAEYIRSFSTDTQQKAIEALQPFDIDYTPQSFPIDCANAFADCLYQCALLKPGRDAAHPDDDRNAIEESLCALIASLSKTDKANSLVQLRYEAVKSGSKIAAYPNRKLDHLLEEKINYHIVRYYRFIQEQIGLLEQCGALNFHVVARAIQEHYESLKAAGHSSVEVYFKMRDYIYKTTKANNETACEILVAFFVQNCEVFDAPTE